MPIPAIQHLRVLLLSVLILTILAVTSPAVGQDNGLSVTDASTLEATTAVPTGVPTIQDTPTDTPTVVPTLEATATDVPLIVPTIENTATDVPTPEATAPDVQATVAPTLPTPGLINSSPEPALTLIDRELFDDGNVSNWSLGSDWTLTPVDNGTGIETSVDNALAIYTPFSLGDVAVQVQYALGVGTGEVIVRQSASGDYRAQLTSSGQITLLRNGIAFASAAVTLNSPAHTLRLSVMGHTLRVAVDDVSVIQIDDPQPLPAGTVGINATFADTSVTTPLIADNLFIWVPSDQSNLYTTPVASTLVPEASPTTMLVTTPPPTMAVQNVKPIYPLTPTTSDVAAEAVSNDLFANATATNLVPYTITGNSTGAGLETGETVSSCSSASTVNTVWYVFSVPFTGQYTVSTLGSGYDTILAMYTGSAINALTAIDCNDDFAYPSIVTSQVTVNLTQFQTVFIQIAGYNGSPSGSSGSYKLSISANVQTPAVPMLVSPTTAAQINSGTPTLRWNSAAWAVSYQVQIDINRSFTNPLYSAVVPTLNTTSSIPLANGTYYWRVRGANINNVYGNWSSVFSLTVDLLPPTTPTIKTLADNILTSSTRPTFSWGAVAGAKSYHIQINSINDFTTPYIDTTVTGVSYTPANPLPQGTWYWHVQGVDSATNASAWTTPRTFTVNILLNPANNGFVTTTIPVLKWAAVPGATGYQVDIATDSSFNTVVQTFAAGTGTITSYTVSPALNYGDYYWRVNVNGVSPVSSISAKFTISTPPLPAPGLLNPGVLVNSHTPTFLWTDVGGASGYQIQIATDSTFKTIVQANSPSVASYDATSLSDGAYYWRVRTVNSYNVAGSWTAARKLTIDTIPLGSVQLTKPATGSLMNTTTISLTWVKVSGAIGYRITIATDPQMTNVIGSPALVTTTTYTPPQLGQGLYYWQVEAQDAALNWSVPTARNFIVSILNTPGDGSVFTSATTTTPQFSWVTVPGAVSYQLEVATDTDFNNLAFPSVTISTTSYTVPAGDALSANTYYWRVNITGLPSASPIYRAFTVSPPLLNAPTLSSPANGTPLNNSTPALSWNTVAGAVGYRVQVADSSTFSHIVQEDASILDPTTSYDATALSDGSYFWRVSSLNALNVGGNWSAVGTFIVDTTAPSVPVPTSPVSGANLTNVVAILTWKPVPTADFYEVEVLSDSTFVAGIVADESTVAATTYTTKALAQGLYSWHVRAHDTAGNWSNWSVDRPLTLNLLTSPANSAILTSGKPTFRWTAVSGALSYQFDLATDVTFINVVQTQPTTSTSYTPSAALGNGTYYWRVSVDIGSGLMQPTLGGVRIFTLTDATPAATALTAPATNTLSNVNTPTFTWNTVNGAAGYYIQIGTSTTFTTVVQENYVITAPTRTYVANALPDGIYYWHVRASNSDGVYGNWSPVWKLTIDTSAPDIPTLNLPTDTATFAGTQPTFSWKTVSGAYRYEFQYGTTNPPTITISDLKTISYKPSGPLPAATYYWRVRVRDQAGNWSDWSTPYSTVVMSASTGVPLLNRNTTNTPTISWGAVTWAAGYEIQINNVSNFTTPYYDDKTIDSSTLSVTLPTLSNGTWYWRVRAIRANGTFGTWSTTSSFTVES